MLQPESSSVQPIFFERACGWALHQASVLVVPVVVEAWSGLAIQQNQNSRQTEPSVSSPTQPRNLSLSPIDRTTFRSREFLPPHQCGHTSGCLLTLTLGSESFSHKHFLCIMLGRSVLIHQSDFISPHGWVFSKPLHTSFALRMKTEPLQSCRPALLGQLLAGIPFLLESSFGSLPEQEALLQQHPACVPSTAVNSLYSHWALTPPLKQTGSPEDGDQAWTVHSCGSRASCSAWPAWSLGHMCVELMNEQVREFRGKREYSGGTENVKMCSSWRSRLHGKSVIWAGPGKNR